jgi:signal transduction histidine kinase/DNA-binding response OmpR family regulator/HPt (histidine-containing phosphotransfer) domain-containing protein
LPAFLAPFFSTLTAKLLIFLLPAIIGSTASLFWLFEKHYQQEQFNELRLRLENFTSLQRTALAGPMWSLDMAAINTLVRGYATDIDLEAAAVFNEHDKMLASTGAIEALSLSNPLRSDTPIVYVHGGKEEFVGRIEVGFNARRLEAEQRKRVRTELLVLAVLLLVITGGTVIITRRILGLPLQRLLISLEHASNDSVRIREPVRWESSDELGAVVRAYNLLLAREAVAEAKIRDYRSHLEELVAKRTKQLEAASLAAEEASRAKSDFLANMSHEIRTPMNAIIGLSHLALRTQLDHRQQDYLNKIHGSAKSLLGIINDILDFSKIEAGKLNMEAIPFQIENIFRSLSDMIGLKAAEKGLEFLIAIDPMVPHQLIGDPLRLNQVLLNLCSNAVKFTTQGEVKVTCDLIDERNGQVALRFKVVDSGIGLSREQQGHLFKAFSQADSSTTRRYGGTGLGLVISKRIVEMMDGEIGVESAEGKGSTFWFVVRLAKGVGEPENPVEDISLFASLRTLVVDDNLFARATLAGMLKSIGCTADHVATGAEAVAMVDHEAFHRPFDIVFIDWLMPEMDGTQVVEQIRDLGLPKTPEMVIVSGYGRDELVAKVEQLGLPTVLLKPVSRSTLVDTLLRTFGRDALPANPAKSPTTEVEFRPGTRVLIVEDNDINQMVAREVLEQAGIEVAIANNGQEGVDAVMSASFDAVLMDVQMPILDGYEATDAIRAVERFADLPIIAMTANAMAGDREKAIASGMNDHVGKPFDAAELLDVLKRWVSRAPASTSDQPSSKGAETPVLPVLPGLDFTAGLRHAAGNSALFHKVLSGFRDSQRDFATRFSAILADGDVASALRLAHTLKGLAASIGAGALATAAADLETAVDAGRAAAVIQPVLARLETALAEVLAGLDSLLGGNAKRAPTLDLGITIANLRPMLENCEFEAAEMAQTLADELAGGPFEGTANRLINALRSFDFAAATDAADALSAQLAANANESPQQEALP